MDWNLLQSLSKFQKVFLDLDKTTLKFTWKGISPGTGQAILNKTNKVGGITLPCDRGYQGAAVIKAVQ